jgi:hypothetical protein
MERRATVEVWLAGKEKPLHTINITPTEIRAKARTFVTDNLTANGSLPKMSPVRADENKKTGWRESKRSEIR